MSPSHSRHSPPAPELLPGLLDELVLEILVRIPPDRPECLVRASLVSKAWRRALSDPAFCRRYRDFHRKPPLLGFFFADTFLIPATSGGGFVPTTAFRARITAPTPSSTWELVVNACHGRVLVDRPMHADFMVWDPITGDQRRVPFPANCSNFTCAVLCATAGCDHRGCHGGPFLLAFVYKDSSRNMSARVYSSEDGAWSDMTSIEHPEAICLSPMAQTSVRLGSTVYMPRGTIITAYNLDDRQLNSIDVPSAHYNHESSILMTAHDGTLGLAGLEESKLLHLWSRKAGRDGAMAWAHDRVIDLETVLPIRGLSTNSDLAGFADGIAVFFISTDVGVFTIELSSGRVHKVSSRAGACSIIPYTSFCTLDHAARRLPSP